MGCGKRLWLNLREKTIGMNRSGIMYVYFSVCVIDFSGKLIFKLQDQLSCNGLAY